MFSSEDIAVRLAFPILDLLNPYSRVGYVYQASALVIAIGAYAYLRYVLKKTDRPLLQWLFPAKIWLHRSAKTDYLFFITNRILEAFFLVYFLAASSATKRFVSSGLEWAFGEGSAATVDAHWGWAVVMTLVTLLSRDFWMWVAHTLFHFVPVLWEFHKVHHSAEVMTPITATRMHPVEEAFTVTLVGVGTGVSWAFLVWWLGPGVEVIKLMNANILVALFNFAAFNLRHSQVWIQYPYWLQFILISPAQHQIHHSAARPHWDKNMGYVFAIWDWAFGTLYNPRRYEKLVYGLGTDETPEFQSLFALYLRPFRNVWGRLRRRVPAPSVEVREP
ncbi:MAG: sterol desaturase family protein [Deltaproteobacteria bacterium]|nr:MAG: sterol desaturase family protein [Deltaproteobacteria bacterium]